VPADAYYAVSVGAVNTGGDLASFSSLGPTFDGTYRSALKLFFCLSLIGYTTVEIYNILTHLIIY
jgi:hypothetical protein